MANDTGQRQYGAGSNSSIGSQIRTDFYQKKALIEVKKEQYFSQLADVTSMPKNTGKTLKKYHYLPILDDANINDQGIDASGASTTLENTIVIKLPDTNSTGNGYVEYYAVGEGDSHANALAAAKLVANDIFKNLDVFDTNYATTKAALEALTPAWTITESATSVPNAGNLYGSSKDIGYMQSKMPTLSETGGRVNRVGMKRIDIEGTIQKYGFFDEYTQESLDFDTDEELEMHINRELVFAANEISEDLLQIDLLNSAGVIRFGGAATSTAEVTGEGATPSVITYEDLMKLSIDLDNNRCPKQTKLITGSRMVDTKTVPNARYLYIGTELVPSIKRMVDLFGNQAFIPVEKYASAGTVANGEIGAVDQFRIIVVPEMAHWAGAGATATGANAGYRITAKSGVDKYNVYPMLFVGDASFTTIGFQTDGKTVKFKIVHKKPSETVDRTDPYGETGLISIKWWYGFMCLRPERIAVMKCVAEW